MNDPRKQSLYLPGPVISEIENESVRQDRSLSWIVQQAWRIARSQIMAAPTVNPEVER